MGSMLTTPKYPCETNTGRKCPYEGNCGNLGNICMDMCGCKGMFYPISCSLRRVLWSLTDPTGTIKKGKDWSIEEAYVRLRHWTPLKGTYSYEISDAEGNVLLSGSFNGAEKVFQFYEFFSQGFLFLDPVKEGDAYESFRA